VRAAEQAAQITARIPGWIARLCGWFLTSMLTDAGDLAAAERVGAAGLAGARDVGDLFNLAPLLTRMALVDLLAARCGDAAAHLREGIQIAARIGSWIELLNGLDYCGYLCAVTGRPAEAVTMWAAQAASLHREGFADTPADAGRRGKPLRQARQALGPDRARAAEDRGAAMSLGTAAEYALLLTAPGPPQPQAAAGLGKLTARERELVALVAQGRTDAQIAAQLRISIRTVSSHMDRIRHKTGCRRRADLTRLALGAGLI